MAQICGKAPFYVSALNHAQRTVSVSPLPTEGVWGYQQANRRLRPVAANISPPLDWKYNQILSGKSARLTAITIAVFQLKGDFSVLHQCSDFDIQYWASFVNSNSLHCCQWEEGLLNTQSLEQNSYVFFKCWSLLLYLESYNTYEKYERNCILFTNRAVCILGYLTQFCTSICRVFLFKLSP